MRFVLVGFGNAVISFGILNYCFYILDQSKIVSSVIATSCALLFSFVMNRNIVFADKSRKIHKQIVPFVIVTVSGSLLVLNAIYILMLSLLSGRETLIINVINNITGVVFSKSFIDINVSTAVGAVVAMAWNYNGYRIFVFKGARSIYKLQMSEDEKEPA